MNIYSHARRRWLARMTAAAAIVPGGYAGLIAQALAAGNAPIAPGLHKVSGDVRVNGAPARQGMLVKPGDTITTGPGAEAIYVIGQDAFLQRDNSTVSFGAETAAHFMRVVTGKVLSVFGKRDRPLRIATTTATIGIRGTGCYIEDEVHSDAANYSGGGTAPGRGRRTYFCLCYGEAELMANAAPQDTERYVTQHHEKPMYVLDDPAMAKKMAPASVKNHNDQELTMLEALVGRRTPFFGREGEYQGG